MRFLAAPWRYFQLNAPWYNEQRRLFSKLETDQAIPAEWRLKQFPLESEILPDNWPVFLKPEWGQNGRGIHVAEDADHFARLRAELLQCRIPYLVQEAARGQREFEIFYIRDHIAPERPAILSITETLHSNGDRWPVHSIRNKQTRYLDITTDIPDDQLRKLWKMMNRLGDFRIARIGVKADSVEEMLAGRLQIIEINLFVPMPLMLLDPSKPFAEKHRFIRKSMAALARATKTLPVGQRRKSIFWPMLWLNARI